MGASPKQEGCTSKGREGQSIFSTEVEFKYKTHSEQGSSSVRSARYTFAKWMNSIPMACLEVSKNLHKTEPARVTNLTGQQPQITQTKPQSHS